MATVVLLVLSNIFMTFAWYGHLKFKGSPLWVAILASWGIAFFEYCLQVPANRMGHGAFSAFQLKILQEVITISVFIAFAVLYLNEKPQWNHLVSFLFILGAVFFAFYSPAPN
ncbi:MAG: DMT family protein [Leptospirales bacterium]|nr:DMT family protein [Leptospirales bacterium]